MTITLTINAEHWLEFLCNPEYIEALAVGFLYNEGLIGSISGITQLRVYSAGDNVYVRTAYSIEKPIRWRRTSGCTGGMTAVGYDLEPRDTDFPSPPHDLPEHIDDVTLAISQINKLIFGLFRAQRLHRLSGGVHASALNDGRKLLLSCEDIGRHNLVDKLAGRVLLENIAEPRRVILTIGRISSKMLQNAWRIGGSSRRLLYRLDLFGGAVGRPLGHDNDRLCSWRALQGLRTSGINRGALKKAV